MTRRRVLAVNLLDCVRYWPRSSFRIVTWRGIRVPPALGHSLCLNSSRPGWSMGSDDEEEGTAGETGPSLNGNTLVSVMNAEQEP
jgi:hypothetical protein